VKIPTFSRHSASDNADDRFAAANGSTVAKPDDATTTHYTTAGAAADRAANRADRADTTADRAGTKADRAETKAERAEAKADGAMATHDRDRDHDGTVANDHDRVTPGKKPRASLMATLGLILGVASALLVLSGPLLGYGIGLAVVALVLSMAGIFATRRRHVAGKSDALIGMVLSLAAIVVGVLALTGSLSWLGTDMQPVNSLREWLDAQFVDRF
jgi:hypothetical protein